MMRSLARPLILLAAALGLAACATTPIATVSSTERGAIQSRLMADIGVLASDGFGGRMPGTEGERLTTDYIVKELQAAGLQSGTNDPGSAWRAPVNLVSTAPRDGKITLENDETFTVYDTSGPYTDESAQIDIMRGLPKMRRQWILDRGDVEEIEGREVQAIDNGYKQGKASTNHSPPRRISHCARKQART